MSNTTSELDALVPDEIYVKVKGEEIEIKPFRFLNLLKVLKILFKMTEGISITSLDELSIVKMLADNPEDTLRIFGLATGKQVNFFEDIDSEEGTDLITNIFKVNQDFFIQKLVPKLKALNESSNSLSPEMTQEPSQQSEEGQENLPKSDLESEKTES